jgi:DNA (cytosine-5)-methyltransferase 1
MVSGGPPCQPFSLGGKAQAYNDKRDMFPQAVRAVREIKPAAFVFENVKGLLRSAFSDYFSYIILQLENPSIIKSPDMDWLQHKQLIEEYQREHGPDAKEYIVRHELLNAADYGVPQIRHRVFIVGFRRDINTDWAFPEATHSKDMLLYDKWVSFEYWKRHNLPVPQHCGISEVQKASIIRKYDKEASHLLPWKTVRDAISDLPDPIYRNTVLNHEYRPGAKSYDGHSGSVLDEPSKTIKAGAHGVPGGENMVILDDGSSRYYTVRESARIQTFPNDYLFSASWTESMRQIGNAVPVKLAEAVGKSVYDHLRRFYDGTR